MFSELPRFLKSYQKIETFIDVGCGYGVPGCWLLERFPGSKIYGVDPDPKRVRVAARAVGERGVIILGRAPEIPGVPGRADLAIMLDSLHYLMDEALKLTLQRLRDNLYPGSNLIIRAPVTPERRFPWAWWFENIKSKILGIRCYYRTLHDMEKMLVEEGFEVELTAPSGTHGELVWLIVRTKSSNA
jgi:trans-aconitate methyltransferase